MEGHRFDSLMRTLAAPRSRRRLLRGFVVTATTGLALRLSTGAVAAQVVTRILTKPAPRTATACRLSPIPVPARCAMPDPAPTPVWPASLATSAAATASAVRKGKRTPSPMSRAVTRKVRVRAMVRNPRQRRPAARTVRPPTPRTNSGVLAGILHAATSALVVALPPLASRATTGNQVAVRITSARIADCLRFCHADCVFSTLITFLARSLRYREQSSSATMVVARRTRRVVRTGRSIMDGKRFDHLTNRRSLG